MQSNNNNNKKLQIEVLRNKKESRISSNTYGIILPETKERQPAPRKADLEPREQNEEKSTTNTTMTLLPPPPPHFLSSSRSFTSASSTSSSERPTLFQTSSVVDVLKISLTRQSVSQSVSILFPVPLLLLLLGKLLPFWFVH